MKKFLFVILLLPLLAQAKDPKLADEKAIKGASDKLKEAEIKPISQDKNLSDKTHKEAEISTEKRANRITIDEMVCTVHGPERTYIFCESDTKRAGIGGAAQGSLQDLITNELIYQDALHYKVPIDETVIDNYIAGIQQQHNLSLEDVKKIFKTSGYTLEEGRDELRKMYAVNSMVEMKIKANLIIPEKEVIAFYEANPIKKEAKFQIQRALVPFDSTDEEKAVQKKLARFKKTGSGIEIPWSDPIWFEKSDISEKFQFITTMNEGEIANPQRMPGGFELFKLIKKKPEKVVPLKKRYREIVEEKRRPKFEQMFEEYTKSLLDSSGIVYFNQVAVAA